MCLIRNYKLLHLGFISVLGSEHSCTSVELKNLTFNTSNNNFIYFNTQFHNASCINTLIFAISQHATHFFTNFFISSSLPQSPISDKIIIFYAFPVTVNG